MVYRNIKAEMRREGITQEQIADYLGMTSNNLSLKLNGKVVLTAPEAVAIQKRFFPRATLDYLLEQSDPVAV